MEKNLSLQQTNELFKNYKFKVIFNTLLKPGAIKALLTIYNGAETHNDLVQNGCSLREVNLLVLIDFIKKEDSLDGYVISLTEKGKNFAEKLSGLIQEIGGIANESSIC